jgi:hypothetical protein
MVDSSNNKTVAIIIIGSEPQIRLISDMICEDWFVGDSQIWNHGVDTYTLMQKMEDGSDPH